MKSSILLCMVGAIAAIQISEPTDMNLLAQQENDYQLAELEYDNDYDYSDEGQDLAELERRDRRSSRRRQGDDRGKLRKWFSSKGSAAWNWAKSDSLK